MRVISKKPLEIDEKECMTCKKILPTTLFRIRQRKYYHPHCLECERKKRKAEYWEDRKAIYHIDGRRKGRRSSNG